MTSSGMEMPTEEMQLNGLLIKFFVKSDPEAKEYTISCKAYDQSHSLLWSTELLDQSGKPQTFHSLATAITKSRNIFNTYRKDGVPS